MGGFTPASFEQAREYLERAGALDPRFAAAHAGLGMYFMMLAMIGASPAHDVMPRAREAAQKAVAIDPSDSDGYVILGMVAVLYDYDWKKAERCFSQAIAHGQMPIRCRMLYAPYLATVGRLRDCESELRGILEEDPLNAAARWFLANCLNLIGRYGEAETHARKALESNPSNYNPYLSLAFSRLRTGGVTAAVAYAEEAYSRAPWHPNTAGVLAGLLRLAGQAARADDVLQRLGPSDGYGVPYSHAMCHLMNGELDQAVDWWAKAIEQRYPYAVFNAVGNPVLRSSPGWPRLAKLLNLPAQKSEEVEKVESGEVS